MTAQAERPVTGGKVKEARDFTYIKPAKRRLSEYEAVTCYLQPAAEPSIWDGQAGFMRRDDGRYAWDTGSTVLRHPHWWDFRDPAAMWFRPYVRQQGEQERAIGRLTEDMTASGQLAELDASWLTDVLAGHWAVWSYVEWGLFRALVPAARETLSETIGMAMLLEGFDRVRHSQDVERYMLTLEEAVPGFSAGGAKDAWLTAERWQPVRRVVEELMFTVADWAETAVAINLVFDPILSDICVSRVIGRPAARRGDPVTQLIVSSVDRDRRRNLAWTQALVRMVTADDLPDATANRDAINGWLARWTPPVLDAAKGFAPLHAPQPAKTAAYGDVVAEVTDVQRKLVSELGLEGPA